MREHKRVSRLTVLVCLASMTAACGSLPVRTPPEMPAFVSADSGPLQRAAETIAAGLEEGQSAFWLLDGARFSFEARLALVDRAETALDIQYFIWEKDPTSRLFAYRVLLAADRGVRVRILLDDLTLNGQDSEFSALASHPNIAVRSFNPWRLRSNFGRVAEFMLNFGRLNHRMHNKTVIADGRFAILGGRNIGDRYFGTWDAFVQNDLDAMASGPAATEVARSFDLYWNSTLSYALGDIATPKASAQPLESTREFLRSAFLSNAEQIPEFFGETETWDDFLEYIIENYTAGFGRLLQDLPDVEAAMPDQLYQPLLDMIAMAEERVLLSTAYLIPDQRFLDLLVELEERGVDVVLLTNSMASNNHKIAHLAYKRARRELLGTGVELYEARADSAFITEYAVPPIEPAFLGLHSKAIVVDDRMSFVGSPNIDPRSLIINTEIGFFVDSEELARRVAALIERDISPDAAWRVYLDPRGRLRWESSAGVEKNQPAQGFMQRVTAFFINLLPLKSQA